MKGLLTVECEQSACIARPYFTYCKTHQHCC